VTTANTRDDDTACRRRDKPTTRIIALNSPIDAVSGRDAYVCECCRRRQFRAAAEILDCTPSAISKLISRLEDRLNVRLLHRTTRRLALTPEGETYYARAREILAAIDEAEAEVSRSGTQPRGRLRVSCGKGVAINALGPILPEFLDRYPHVAVELRITDRVVDLIAENVDVAVRTGAVPDSSLILRRLTIIERGLFAAPSYLARRCTPRTYADLGAHNCIVWTGGPGLQRWPFRQGKDVRQLKIAARIVTDDAEAALRLATAGGGVVRVSELLAGPAVREGRLVPVSIQHHAADQVPMSVVYPQGRHHMPKIRVFVDFLVERLAPAPWRSRHAPRSGRTTDRSQ
jgi:DNA-binding transcriptional LysR family regulator